MRNFLTIVLILVVAIAVIGWYQDWYHVSTNNTDNKVNVDVTVDKNKVKEDTAKAKEKLDDLGHRVKEKAEEAKDKVKR